MLISMRFISCIIFIFSNNCERYCTWLYNSMLLSRCGLHRKLFRFSLSVELVVSLSLDEHLNTVYTCIALTYLCFDWRTCTCFQANEFFFSFLLIFWLFFFHEKKNFSYKIKIVKQTELMEILCVLVARVRRKEFHVWRYRIWNCIKRIRIRYD